MNQFYCPTCNVELMVHPVGKCLNAWVAEVVFGPTNIRGLPDTYASYSTEYVLTQDLMAKVWELNPGAVISSDAIIFNGGIDIGWKVIQATTFPLRASRAALYLTLSQP